jgi:hypothetical protein
MPCVTRRAGASGCFAPRSPGWGLTAASRSRSRFLAKQERLLYVCFYILLNLAEARAHAAFCHAVVTADGRSQDPAIEGKMVGRGINEHLVSMLQVRARHAASLCISLAEFACGSAVARRQRRACRWVGRRTVHRRTAPAGGDIPQEALRVHGEQGRNGSGRPQSSLVHLRCMSLWWICALRWTVDEDALACHAHRATPNLATPPQVKLGIVQRLIPFFSSRDVVRASALSSALPGSSSRLFAPPRLAGSARGGAAAAVQSFLRQRPPRGDGSPGGCAVMPALFYAKLMRRRRGGTRRAWSVVSWTRCGTRSRRPRRCGSCTC